MRRLKTKLASIPSFNGHYEGGLIEICKLTSMGECGNFLSLSFEFTPYCQGTVETVPMESIFADFVPDKKDEHGD